MYLGTHPKRPVPVSEICRSFAISQNHLAKVANKLQHLNFVKTRRGKMGGYLLAKEASEIGVGEVIRQTEPDLDLLECFNSQTNTCKLINSCRLKQILVQAQFSFLGVLDQYTLADLLNNRDELREILAV
jgi:Rrf2 family transcriptional regulator, nitric oxide-sensitive transcriptional repressor